MDSNTLKNQIDQIANLSISSDDGHDKNRCSGKIITCTYCAITFRTRADLRQHCQTETHQNVIMSDEGRDWKWRPPPRGYTADSYTLCETFMENSTCHYGNQCVEAHGEEELHEWKDRFEYRKMRLQRACEKELFGKSFTEQLLEKWVTAASPDKIMKEKIDTVEETCSNELVTTVSSKVSKREWTFVLKTKRMLKAVALLQDAHRNHFMLKQVYPAEPRPSKRGQTYGNKVVEAELLSDQEWIVPNPDERYSEIPNERSPILEHRVKVVFSTDIYGTFRQSVVFDFGAEPVLVKHFCVDVIPVTDADKIQEIKKEMVVTSSQRWDESNSQIIPYTAALTPHQPISQTQKLDEEREHDLIQRYPCPRASTFTLTQSTITEKKLTKNNYRSRMHELLYVEEIARYDQVARYNLTTKLQITNNYLLSPSGMATSTAKYSHSGELFALLSLGKDVSEDTSAGRLILNNCASVYISNAGLVLNDTDKRKVYEGLIEDKGKSMIYLKLSAQCVSELGLTAETEFLSDIQFQLNRLTYCEWHHAIDKIADYRVIFPETFLEPSIPWTPKKQWSDALDPRLNSKQKEAILAITAMSNVPLPPILLIGPFGTGKTYTLASSIQQLLLQPDARILICTHSNSAADLYIKEYLHPWVEEGNTEATPLRVYYHKRWVATVNTIVQKYCLIDLVGAVRVFRRPTKEDLMQFRIVVVTLNISMELASLDLPKGYFTHILLDEAAQAMECEAIMPIALAGENTRIVLAGDHMQMSPEIFSNFAKERRLHISLLERLYDHYPVDFPCKILLCENYRAHEAIIKFTSELFYDQKLIASGKQPRHEKYYPLTFFTTRGEDVQDKNSTAFYNNSEVYEVVERVQDLRKHWPTSWGKMSDQSIGIMTPYADQVFRIRSELRKRKMGGISVERVLNVQGKQFRAIFLSTVRTRRTCPNTGNANSNNQTEDMDYGFLSNSKLLNTAITRAQSLVAVVGDPIALCSIGRCRKVWERFIDICNQNKSLFGITWSLLRSQLDGVELKKTFQLNPLAKEFVPRAMQAETYLRDQQMAMHNNQQQTQIFQHVNPTHMMPHNMPHVGYSTQTMLNQQIRMCMRPVTADKTPRNVPIENKVTPAQPFFYPNQQQQHPPMIRNQSMPQPINYAVNNYWAPLYNSNQNSWNKTGQHAVRPPQQPQQMNLNMPLVSRQPSTQFHYMQNNKQPPPLYGGNVQNHMRNVNAAHNPAAQLTQNPVHNPPDMNMSPLTNDIMASIKQRVSQVHQQNMFKTNPIPPQSALPPQVVPPVNKPYSYFVDGKNHHSIDAPPMIPHAQVPPNLSHPMQAPQPKSQHTIMNPGPQKLASMHQLQLQPDYSHLLPPNMTYYDMALEPNDIQFKWYMKLSESHGIEAANKYAEILNQISQSVESTLMAKPTIPMNAPPVTPNLTANVDIMFESLVNGPAPILNELLNAKKDLTNDTAGAFSILGTSATSLPHRNGGDHSSIMTANDLLNSRAGDMGLQPKNQIQQASAPTPVTSKDLYIHQQQQQQQQAHQQAQQQQQQSIPLYRRQAGSTFNTISPNQQSANDNSMFDGPRAMLHHDIHGLQRSMGINGALNHATTYNELNQQTSTQHYQGLTPTQGHSSASLSNAMHPTQSLYTNSNQNLITLGHLSRAHNSIEPNKRIDHDEHQRQANNSATTYASVLSQGASNQHANQSQTKQQSQKNDADKDPFAAIRELGQRSNGLYNYFQ